MIALLFGAGCTKRLTLVERGNRDQVLHLGNGAEPADLDPQTVLGIPESQILYSLFEPLTLLDPVDLHPVPAASTGWEVSSDGLVYTFYLRPDARWSNGDPVTARDWVYSYRRLLTKGLAAQFSYNAFYVANAEEYLTGKITDFAQVGVREMDPLTLEFRLRSPTPFFPSALSAFTLLPVHPGTIEKFGALDRPNTMWTRTGNLVSNGPFMLKDWKPNQFVSVVPNPYYWDRAKVRLKEIRFYGVDSEDSEERMFRAGQIHATYNMPLAKIDLYRAKEPDLLRITEYYGTYYFNFNTRKPPLHDPRVRRALAMTIDRKAIIDNVARAGQQPAFEFAPPGAGGYTPGALVREDRDEARRLLAEAGFPGGRGFPKLELLFNTSEQHRPICEAIQQMWKRELGIDVTLSNQEWKVYLNAMRDGTYDIARAGWIGTVPDPHDYLQNIRSSAGNNFTGWGNADYDRILAESERTPENAARFRLLNQLDEIFVREMPLAPLFHYTRPILIRPSVKGFPGNQRDQRWYKNMYLEPATEDKGRPPGKLGGPVRPLDSPCWPTTLVTCISRP